MATTVAAGKDGLYGVYWIGSNGNAYMKDNNGKVSDLGVPSAHNATSVSSSYNSGGNTINIPIAARQIADPNPGGKAATTTAQTTAPSNPNGGGSSTASTYEDKSNDISQQNAALSGADTEYSSGIGQIADQLAKILSGYDTDSANAEGNYTTQSNTNENNLQTNKQTALVNAAQGRQGLFGSLASIGALNGSGIKLANKAVQNGANTDLASGQSNFNTNQTTLDTGIGTFRTDNQKRKDDANTAADQAKQVALNTQLKTKQQALQNLSNDYSAEGNSAQAKSYSDQASALFPQLATSAIPVTTNLSPESATYTPGTLSSYIQNGVNSTSVSSAPGSGNGSLFPSLFASNDSKKKQTA